MKTKKRWLVVVFVLAGMHLLGRAQTAGAAPDDNLAVNPGFESGQSDGWGLFGARDDQSLVVTGPGVAHSGQYALQFTKNNHEEWGMAWQRLDGKVTWGDRITASVWVKRTDKATGTPYMSIAIKERGTYQLLGNASEKAKAGSMNWSRITVEYTVPDASEIPDLNKVHIEINIGMEGFQEPNRIVIDDLVVRKK